MEINDILIAEREKRKISQRGLALKSGVSNATISRIESGEVIPDTATLSKLATALNLDMRYLLGEANIHPLHIPDNIKDTKVAFYGGVEGLNQQQIDKVSEYIDFLKSQNRD